MPVDGKNLPQTLLQPVLKSLKIKLPALINDIQVSDIEVNSLTEQLDGSIESDIDANIVGLQVLLDQLVETEPTLEKVLGKDNLLNVSKPVQDEITPELKDANELVSNLIRELSSNPVPIQAAQIDNSSLATNISEYQRSLVNEKQINHTEIQQRIVADFAVESKQPVVALATQKHETSENKSANSYEFTNNILSEESAFKNVVKNPAIGADIFQQNINAIKSDPISLNLNTSSVIDTYNSHHPSGLQNKVIEAPIPLLIKQGVSVEQVQQNVDQSISQNIKWLIGNNTQNAKINIYPESLGQVNIALNLEDTNLKINFLASNNVTKELIEASVSSLRNHFNESGINLQEVNVETRFSSQTNQNSQFSDLNDQNERKINSNSSYTTQDDEIVSWHESTRISTPRYLLDAYA